MQKQSPSTPGRVWDSSAQQVSEFVGYVRLGRLARSTIPVISWMLTSLCRIFNHSGEGICVFVMPAQAHTRHGGNHTLGVKLVALLQRSYPTAIALRDGVRVFSMCGTRHDMMYG
jgi:hypothetical protein